VADAHEHAALTTTVLDVSGLQWASEQAVVKRVVGHCAGVESIDVNPVGQTATVAFDPAQISLADLRRCIVECGYHCAGQSVPVGA
jgi:P-type Cu2+ transporter